MSVSPTIVLALYPRSWRERYGTEVSELTAELIEAAQVTPLQAGLDLLAGAAREHRRILIRLRRVLAVAVTAVAVATLAAAYQPRGGGEIHPYFYGRSIGVVFLMLWACWVLVEVFVALYLRQEQGWRRPGATFRARSGPRLWLVGPLATVLINAALYLGPYFVPGAAIRPGAAAAGAGLAVMLAGMGLRLWSFTALGRYGTWNIVVSQGQPIVSRGPYRLLRHPAYAGALLICVGFGLACANWAVLAATVVIPLALIVWCIRTEENAMVQVLGDSYRAYAAGHRRLVPLVW